MRRLIGVVALVGLGLAWSEITTRRVQLWGDPLALWIDAVEQAPAKPRPWINLGTQYGRLRRWADATDSYRQAMELAGAPWRTHDELVYGTAIAQANLSLLLADHGEQYGPGRTGAGDGLDRLVNVLHRFGLRDVHGVRAWLTRRAFGK
jgi:tetratricopeptide (TPR) repeat protein